MLTGGWGGLRGLAGLEPQDRGFRKERRRKRPLRKPARQNRKQGIRCRVGQREDPQPAERRRAGKVFCRSEERPLGSLVPRAAAPLSGRHRAGSMPVGRTAGLGTGRCRSRGIARRAEQVADTRERRLHRQKKNERQKEGSRRVSVARTGPHHAKSQPEKQAKHFNPCGASCLADGYGRVSFRRSASPRPFPPASRRLPQLRGDVPPPRWRPSRPAVRPA